MRRRRRLCPWSSWKPPKLLGHSTSIAVYSTVACDARHRFGEYVVEHAEHVPIVIAKNYSRRASLARLVPWDRVGTSRRLDVPQSAPKAPARPGLSFTPLVQRLGLRRVHWSKEASRLGFAFPYCSRAVK